MSIVALVIAPGIALQDTGQKAEKNEASEKEIVTEASQSETYDASNTLHLKNYIRSGKQNIATDQNRINEDEVTTDSDLLGSAGLLKEEKRYRQNKSSLLSKQ
jgi:hypothetical protein